MIKAGGEMCVPTFLYLYTCVYDHNEKLKEVQKPAC